jgi:hypothetical protein
MQRRPRHLSISPPSCGSPTCTTSSAKQYQKPQDVPGQPEREQTVTPPYPMWNNARPVVYRHMVPTQWEPGALQLSDSFASSADVHALYAWSRGQRRGREATTRREESSLGSDVGLCRYMHLSADDSLINGPRSKILQFLYRLLGLKSDNAFTDDQPSLILENTKKRLKDCKIAKDRIDSVRNYDGSPDQCGSATSRLICLFDTKAGNEMDGDTWVLEDGGDIRVDYKGIWQREMGRRVCIESRLSISLLNFWYLPHVLTRCWICARQHCDDASQHPHPPQVHESHNTPAADGMQLDKTYQLDI